MSQPAAFRKLFSFVLCFTSCFAALSLVMIGHAYAQQSLTSVPSGSTINVTVSAQSPSGVPLSYRWLATDGVVANANTPSTSPNTTWTLPKGQGLHFLYVLVSDSQGGYTEKRIAIFTTDPNATSPAVVNGDPVPSIPSVPPSPVPLATVRGWLQDQRPGISMQLVDEFTGKQFGPVITDNEGQFAFHNLPQSTYEPYIADAPGQPFRVASELNGPFSVSDNLGTSNYSDLGSTYTSDRLGNIVVSGHVTLADGSTCGDSSAFFGMGVNAVATLVDSTDKAVSLPVPVNAYGNYEIDASLSTTGTYSVQVQCENAPVQFAPVSVVVDPILTNLYSGVNVTIPSTPPTVTGFAATLNGTPIQLSSAAPATLPSDSLPRSSQFLSTKGEDSRTGACLYYVAVGAATGCDATGAPIGGITFDAWKKQSGLAPYNTTPEASATYTNQVDLNLTRDHHGIQTPNGVAMYVCNYTGPADDTVQSQVDAAVTNAASNQNLVACVAMDHVATPGVNGGAPFTRFLTFGPSGHLLLSVNLDGRGEKFVPGTCVACHGGENYAGGYPTDGTGTANIGAHFLPFDEGNFVFSSLAGFQLSDQAAQIKALNQLVLQTNATPSAVALINAWYLSGSNTEDNSYVPSTWVNPTDANIPNMYSGVIKHSCRTCHIAQTGQWDLDSKGLSDQHGVCGGNEWLPRNHNMPNSKVTFDRMWLSQGSTTPGADQIAYITAWLDDLNGVPTTCSYATPDPSTVYPAASAPRSCNYTFSPSRLSLSGAAQTATVKVTASSPACSGYLYGQGFTVPGTTIVDPAPVVNPAPLTIFSPGTSGTAVTISVTANPDGATRFSPMSFLDSVYGQFDLGITQSAQLTGIAQNISFGPLNNAAVGTPPVVLAAASSSGLPVSLTSTTTGVCTLAGSTVTLVAPGTCTISATQAGNTSYLPATPVVQSFQVTAGTGATIATVAGNGTAGYSGDNGLATSAELYDPFEVAIDGPGNLYIADTFNNRVRKVSTNGVITTVAGNGVAGYLGDSGPATSAELNNPQGLTVDSAGNLYIADVHNNRVRKVSPSGTITTVAGNGVAGYGGDGGAATSASLDYPAGVKLDSAGNLYIADQNNQRIRKVTTSGVITTVAGNGVAGYSGDNGSATSASLSQPGDIAVDTSGNLYIVDQSNNRIRMVNPAGTITTVVGNGVGGYSGDNGPATSAELNSPLSVSVDGAGNLYIADLANSRIREVSGGTITTVAGTGVSGFSGDNGLAINAQISSPFGVSLDSAGNLYIADTYNSRIRKVINISAAKIPQTITFGAAPAVTVGGTGTLSATASSGLAVTFTSTTTSICTASGSTVTGVAAGSCVVAANQAGNTTYAAAPQVTQTITISPAKTAQTITFGAVPTVTVGSTGTLSATASSGLAVTFTSTTTSICTVSGSTVTGVAAGSCVVAANQAGNTTYAAAPQVTQTITVNPAKTAQTITFGAVPVVALGGTGTVSATASSGLAVTFTSTTTSTCSVSGSTVTGVAYGTCTIAANQAGNTTYAAAPQVTQTLTVGKGGQTITLGAVPVVAVGGTETMSATASSGLAVTFTSTTTSICSVSGSTVTGVSAGPCTIAANQAGNTTYTAAPQVTQTFAVGKGGQTITFGAAPALTVGGTGILSATASSGLAATFTSTTTSICTVSGSTVTGVAAGTCTIAANQAGNTNYNAASQVTQSITVTSPKSNQTITFAAAPTVRVGASGTVSATATSGLAVAFTSTTPTVCTVSGSTVTGVATGTCTIAGNQSGSATFNAAPQVTQNIIVGKGSQTIAFGAAPALTVGGTGTLSATASSTLAVTFTSTTTSICTVSGSTVTGVAAGTCTIAANQAGNTNYNSASQVTQPITVTPPKTNQTITFGAAPTVRVGSSGTVSATASSGLAVVFTSTTPTICTVSGSTVTGVAAGACTIAGNQSGNTTFNAAPQVTQNITVGKGSQTITFGTAPPVTVGGTGTVSATATSGLAVTFTSTTTSICTVSGSTVTGVAAGACTIVANQAGNTNYNAASQVTQPITVTPPKTNQTITFGAALTVKVGTTGTVSATATSGLAVAFTSTTPTVCTVSGSTVTGVTAGTCTIAGNQSGNTTYNAAPQVTQNITVGKGSQTITFGTAPPVTVGGTGTLSATATSGLAVTFTSTTTSICTVSGSTVTGVAAGTCTIAANQAGNTNYNSASQVTQPITVTPPKTKQTITFGAAPTAKVGTTGTVSATATSGLAVAFTSTTPTVCTVSGSTVTGVTAGTCTIAGNQSGNTTFNAAPQVTQNIIVGKGSQTITFGTAPPVAVGGTGTVSATATSGLAVTFTSTTTSICTISGSTITGVATGTCTIAANQVGNSNYNAATQVTQNFTVAAAKTNQTITFGAAPTVKVGTTGTVSATATSGLAVAFTSTTPTVCTVSGSTVTGVAAGTCTIAGNQSGNTTFNSAPQVTQNITVGKGSQTITFGTAPAVMVSGTGTVSATATSGLAVTFTSTTTSICTVSGSTVTGVAAGACTIAANQAGNTNYNAASQITQSITVTPPKTNQTITFGAAPSVKVVTTGTVSATATSGLAVTFTSTTPTICTVSGNTVSGVAAGTCTIAGNQSGNTTFNAAPQVTQNITVGKGSQTITFGTAPAVTVAVTGTVSATATSGLAVTFTSTTPSICTVSGSTVTGVATGTCTIAANQAGNTNYNAATQATQNITVTTAKTSQTITFGAAPTVKVGTTGTVSATATSGLAVAFTSTTPTICTVSGATVTGVAAGTCTIAGNQSGNTTFNAAPQVAQNITVGKGSQTITLTVPTSITRPATGTATATVTSGLAVTLTSTTSSICTISGTTVTGIAAGTCTIAANQAGNANYNAATQVSKNITVY